MTAGAIRGRAVAAALMLAGCTLQPAYERPAPPVASSYPTGPAYDRAAQGTGPPAPELGWRDFFSDPRLRQLLEIALDNNRNLRVSVLNIAQARAQYGVQRAALFPQIAGAASITHSRTPADLSLAGVPAYVTEYTVGPQASWEIDFFGRLRSLRDVALEQYLATVQARKAAQIALIAQVANQYLTVLAYDDELDVTRRTLETARESFRIVNLQFETGTTSELDVRQAETVVQQAEANYFDQIRSRAQAENALVLLLGAPMPADLPAGDRLDDQRLAADIPAGLPSDLLQRRPDILQAEEQLRAQNANIGVARAAFFPRISLTGDFGTASASLGGLFKPGSAAWAFGPSVTVPIFQGGLNEANLALARATREVAVAQYELAIQTAFREVADGLAARGTYDDQVRALERYAAAQQRRLELSQLRYRDGIDSYLNVLTAQTAYYDAQLLLVTSRLNRLSNLVTLYEYLGGGWTERTGEAPPDPEARVPVP